MIGTLFWSCQNDVIELDTRPGPEGPLIFNVALSNSQIEAVEEGRLALVQVMGEEENEIPVQLYKKTEENNQLLVALFPEGMSGKQKYKWVVSDTSSSPYMKVEHTAENAQPAIVEGDQSILQYNYHTVYEKDVIRPGEEIMEMEFSEMSSGRYYEEYLKTHPSFPKDTVVTTAVYSVPRSDYIHPLYGLNGEMLTRDWPDGGHPHHRGIFWAWPEVEYKGQRGDIYALQRVFARPTGDIEFVSGPVYAQINAENRWIWEGKEPIVRERVSIIAYRSTSETRIIDLRLEFLALKEDVTIATRFTDSYGGLNIRMQTPEEQGISYFTAEKGNEPRRAPLKWRRIWADFSGFFEGNEEESGMTILQHHSNPEYPGEWVDYPNLSWVQPTFPKPNTRYPLSTTEPLVLKYRFVVHEGGKPADQKAAAWWDAYNSGNALGTD